MSVCRVPAAVRAIGHIHVLGGNLGAGKRHQVRRFADLAADYRGGHCSGVGSIMQTTRRLCLSNLDAAGAAADAGLRA